MRKGTHHSEESKTRISQTMMGHRHSSETKVRMSLSHKRDVRSSIGSKEYWGHKENREWKSRQMKAYWKRQR